MKKLFLVVAIVFQYLFLFSQDQILSTNNDRYDCKIESIDTLSINFTYKNPVSNSWIKKSLPIKDVKYVKYQNVDFIVDSLNINRFIEKVNSLSSSSYLKNIIENTKEDYIYTYSGDIIKGENISFENSDNGQIYFKIDSFKLAASKVKFFNYNDQLWANTQFVHNAREIEFARRLYKGRMNYYEKEVTSTLKTFEDLEIHTSVMMAAVSERKNKEIFAYYNKGFGDLKKVSYKNLMVDLSDNMESMKYLYQYKTLQNGSTTLFIVGVSAILYGFTYEILRGNRDENISGFNKIVPVISIGLGLASIWGRSNLSQKKSKALAKAIESY